MADILIRDVPDAVLVVIDARAERAGLSRTAYLRRVLERERVHAGAVTVDQLQHVAALAAALTDPEVMSDAWS